MAIIIAYFKLHGSEYYRVNSQSLGSPVFMFCFCALCAIVFTCSQIPIMLKNYAGIMTVYFPNQERVPNVWEYPPRLFIAHMNYDKKVLSQSTALPSLLLYLSILQCYITLYTLWLYHLWSEDDVTKSWSRFLTFGS